MGREVGKWGGRRASGVGAVGWEGRQAGGEVGREAGWRVSGREDGGRVSGEGWSREGKWGGREAGG